MSNGLQVFNANGAEVVNSTKFGISRLIYTLTLGSNDVTVSPPGFDANKVGHAALVLWTDAVTVSQYYKVTYPTATSIRVQFGVNGRLVVFGS